jgi:hypothetical protein
LKTVRSSAHKNDGGFRRVGSPVTEIMERAAAVFRGMIEGFGQSWPRPIPRGLRFFAS